MKNNRISRKFAVILEPHSLKSPTRKALSLSLTRIAVLDKIRL